MLETSTKGLDLLPFNFGLPCLNGMVTWKLTNLSTHVALNHECLHVLEQHVLVGLFVVVASRAFTCSRDHRRSRYVISDIDRRTHIFT